MFNLIYCSCLEGWWSFAQKLSFLEALSRHVWKLTTSTTFLCALYIKLLLAVMVTLVSNLAWVHSLIRLSRQVVWSTRWCDGIWRDIKSKLRFQIDMNFEFLLASTCPTLTVQIASITFAQAPGMSNRTGCLLHSLATQRSLLCCHLLLLLLHLVNFDPSELWWLITLQTTVTIATMRLIRPLLPSCALTSSFPLGQSSLLLNRFALCMIGPPFRSTLISCLISSPHTALTLHRSVR